METLLIITNNYALKYAAVELKIQLDIDSRVVAPNILSIESGKMVEDFLSMILLSKTIKRVLLQLIRAPFEDLSDLYELSKSIEWLNFFPENTSFAVRAVDQGYFSQVEFPKREIEKRVGQGIVDSFMERLGRRPPVKLNNPDIEIYSFVSDNEVIISLDLCGYDLNPDEEILARTLVLEANWDFEKEPLIEILSGGVAQSAWDYAKRIPYRGKASKLSYLKTKLLNKEEFLEILRTEWSREFNPQIACYERGEKLDIIKKDFVDYRFIQLKDLNELELDEAILVANLLVAEPRRDEEIKILEKVLDAIFESDYAHRSVFSVRLDAIDIFKKYFREDIEEIESVGESQKGHIKYGPTVKIKGIDGKIVSLMSGI